MTVFTAYILKSYDDSVQMAMSVLQIKSGKRDNLGIIFHITLLKHMF